MAETKHSNQGRPAGLDVDVLDTLYDRLNIAHGIVELCRALSFEGGAEAADRVGMCDDAMYSALWGARKAIDEARQCLKDYEAARRAQ